MTASDLVDRAVSPMFADYLTTLEELRRGLSCVLPSRQNRA